MPARKPATRTTRAPRVSRDDGAELLIAAALDLARSMPIAKVTVREIASAAGLQTMHVKRYFDSRNGLLLAVSNRLMERIVAAVSDRPLDRMFTFLQGNADVELRLRIVSHLLNEGVSAGAFANDRQVYRRVAERIATVNNVGMRTARTYALVIQMVLQGSTLMGGVNGMSARERKDVFGLLVALGTQLSPAESLLDW